MGTNPLQGQVAIIGQGHSLISRNSGMAVGALAIEAAKNAILDAGLTRDDIDGVACSGVGEQPTAVPGYVVEGLGLPNVIWQILAFSPSMTGVIAGVHAVFSGACNYALCVHAKYRWSTTSVGARNDPLRQSGGGWADLNLAGPLTAPYPGANGQAAAMRRHMHEFGTRREHFGYISVNNRTNAAGNERAVYRTPITMEDYLNAPMINDPMCVLDMDVPVDCAMAVVITSAERARDHRKRPVYVEATASGISPQNDLALYPDRVYDGFSRVARTLWNKTGYQATDMDLANIYDGFSSITLAWIEALFCGRGQAGPFLEQSWVEEEQRLKFFGRIPMSTHGGNMSEGRTQGFGHVYEAVQQLSGEAGARQIQDPRLAVVVNGLNPLGYGMILRADV